MAGIRRGSSNRFSAILWPGFVDAMTALLLIVMFVLTIFVVIQSVMRDRISSQDERIGDMGAQVAQLGRALGLAQDEGTQLRQQLADQTSAREDAARTAQANIAALRSEVDAGTEAARLAAARRTALEALIADLRRRADEDGARLGARIATAEAEAEGLGAQLAAADADRSSLRTALDAASEQIATGDADLQLATSRADDLAAQLDATTTARGVLAQQLDEAELARLADAAAAEALRARLADAGDTLATQDLALAEARREAEETLTLLAAAEAARDEAQTARSNQFDEATRQAALMTLAEGKLAEQAALTDEGERQIAGLNAQLVHLRNRLAELLTVLDRADTGTARAELRIDDLGAQLNDALLQAATAETLRADAQAAQAQAETARAEAETARAEAESARAEAEFARAEAEAEARALAEAEALDLSRYRSEFFGRLSQVLAGRDGVEVVGDRFVFSSEVLFGSGEATLSTAGRDQIRAVTALLDSIAGDIPDGIDWVIRVDGHTDDQPLSGSGRYRDNWELSQARALAVLRYMTDTLGFPPDRVVAAGFGQFRPVDPDDSPEARAHNRRIELKLTER